MTCLHFFAGKPVCVPRSENWSTHPAHWQACLVIWGNNPLYHPSSDSIHTADAILKPECRQIQVESSLYKPNSIIKQNILIVYLMIITVIFIISVYNYFLCLCKSRHYSPPKVHPFPIVSTPVHLQCCVKDKVISPVLADGFP